VSELWTVPPGVVQWVRWVKETVTLSWLGQRERVHRGRGGHQECQAPPLFPSPTPSPTLGKES